MRRGSILILLLLSLAACGRSEAPMDDGVCWRAQFDAAGAPRFTRLASGVGSLETCAVLLEGRHLQGASSIDGAFQGYFIFVDPDAITSARHVRGFRYPIFQPPQRAQVDRDLARLMKQNGGRLPDAGQLTLERR